MADNRTPTKIAADTGQDAASGQISLKVDIPDSNEKVICKVCGHPNPKDAGMCAMCSNYLFD